ncbi:hypothetical protein F2Q68_00020424 [Brassica cretica]|uniref:Uncharacterized protein n=1 Tax=Brassica cretica TaxID=69181 RepID=A0A8S9FXX7_BRACR|nr:hypothetical protein F2Q68_00020424 [Brassica cretica]
MRISADDRYQEMPRQMKINIDRCTQIPVGVRVHVSCDRYSQGLETFRRNMVILESFGAFGSAELHRRVRSLAIDGNLPTVNQHPVAEVMPILLKSGQSASREEAAEKRKPRRSIQHSAHRSMEIPDHGPCIFYDQK